MYLWDKFTVDHFKELDDLRNLYLGNHETYFVLPNGEQRRYEYVTVNWLGDVLSTTWRRLLFREFPKITINSDEKDQITEYLKELGLERVFVTADERRSYSGMAVLKGNYSRLSGKVNWVLWGERIGEYVDFEYIDSDITKPVAVNFYYKRKYIKDDMTGQFPDYETAMIRERHMLLFDPATGEIVGTKVVNDAFAMMGNGIPTTEIIEWNKVWVDEKTRPEKEFQNNLTILPVVIISNIDKNGDGLPDSEYSPSLIQLQRNLNKLVSVRQLVIDLGEQPTLVVPPEFMDENGLVDWNKVRLRVAYAGEETDAEIKVTNWSGNLENSDKQWTLYRDEFRALTGITPAVFGALDSEARSGKARRLGLIPTEAEANSKISTWVAGIKTLVNLTIMIHNEYSKTKFNPTKDISVKWCEILPEDSYEKASMNVQEVTAGIRSTESGVSNSPYNAGKTAEWISKEVAIIEKEKVNENNNATGNTDIFAGNQ